jgi:methyl-accepting chemotaxis protein
MALRAAKGEDLHNSLAVHGFRFPAALHYTTGAGTNRLMLPAESSDENSGARSTMKEIHAPSDDISRIIKVIDDIAFQTNILGLNAAVEAARAGEAVLGHAVVAEGVRDLAQRSAQAVKDTAAMIEESIGKSGEGGAKPNQVAEAISAIADNAASGSKPAARPKDRRPAP